MVLCVPPNFQRLLPVVLLFAVLLFVLPTILRKHRSSGPSASTRASLTIDAMHQIDQAEQNYKLAHQRYTSHLADLVPQHKRLADDLANGLSVQLDASTDGQSYLAEVSSDVLSLVRARTRTKFTAHSCLVLKNGSGVNCPP
jgi:hypothetical protein